MKTRKQLGLFSASLVIMLGGIVGNSKMISANAGEDNRPKAELFHFTSEIETTRNGHIISRFYEYDKKLNITHYEEKEQNSTEDEAKLVKISDFSYNSSSLLTNEKSFYYDDETQKVSFAIDYEYEYDSHNNNTKIIEYETNNDIRSISVVRNFDYSYDNKNNVTLLLASIGEEKNPLYRNIYEYDNNSRLISYTYERPNDESSWSVLIKEEYEYEGSYVEPTKFTKIEYSDYYTFTNIKEYTYNSNRKLIKEKTSDEDTEFGYIEYFYDEYNNLSLAKSYDAIFQNEDDLGNKTYSYLLNQETTYEYYKNNIDKLTKSVSTQYDTEDGTVAYITYEEREYDNKGNLIKYSTGSIENGENNVARSIEYLYQQLHHISTGAIIGIVIGSAIASLLIVFVALYILWKEKNFNVPGLEIFLTPAFRLINKLLFKTKLNDIELKKEKHQ